MVLACAEAERRKRKAEGPAGESLRKELRLSLRLDGRDSTML